MTSMTATTAADLSADIEAIDLASQAGDGSGTHYTIALAAGATLTEAADIDAINLKGKDTLTIEGDGAVLDGANAHRGLFVYRGAVTIDDLTIENAVAMGGAGGAGGIYGGGGGAGAGLGGGLFVANDAAHGAGPAQVTLAGVTFSGDSAVGGAGGAASGGYGGCGGGMGGAGGDFRGGGGGIDGMGGVGWPGWPNPVIDPPQPGLAPGAASGGRGGTGELGGISGGGGGAANAYQIGSTGAYEHFGGGGGGIGGINGNSSGDLSHFIGGDGGFGGGGGWAGGNGGFGRGGASTRREGVFAPPGGGGFGGGGAGDSEGLGAGGGFGAGNGGIGGGGGLGAGGDIFVMQGASLTIEGGNLSGGSVQGGAGGYGGGNGQAFGGGIFLQGSEGVTLAPAAGTVETISDVIADQTGSGGAGANAGAGWLVVDGAGTVDLTAANNFTGGIEIDSGVLELANATSENVVFQQDAGSLVLDQPANFSGTISTGAVSQDGQYTVVLEGVSHRSVTSYSYSRGVLTIHTTQGDYAYNFSGSYKTSNFSLAAGPRQLSTGLPSLQITVTPGVVHPNDLALSGDVTGPDDFIDIPNFVASYGVLINAFGANQQAAQNWFNTYEPTEQRAETFDGLDYVASYRDLINTFKSAGSEQAVLDAGATHFINSGYHEGRSITFNGLDYIASYGDLINAFGANGDAGAYHYIESGASEGRKTTFDGLDYIASYSDLIKALGANEQAGATHFIDNGYQEGRKTTFDGLAYIANYTDLMNAFGANKDAGATHYINNGFSEGRSTSFNVGAYESAHPDLIGKYTSKDAFLTAYIDTYKTTGTFLT